MGTFITSPFILSEVLKALSSSMKKIEFLVISVGISMLKSIILNSDSFAKIQLIFEISK